MSDANGSVPASHLGRQVDLARKYRILERLRRRLRMLQYSPRTEEVYCDWVRRFVLFHGRRYPATMGEDEIGQFLTHLASREE